MGYRILLAIALAGCGFRAPTETGEVPLDGPPASDEGGAVPRDIPHVPAAHELRSAVDLTFADGATIDTSGLVITGMPVPAGVVLVAMMQDPTGPEAMLIRAREVSIPEEATVRATGTRPLVILADAITIAGTLDGGGQLGMPGPNGGSLAMTALGGTGGPGEHRGSFNDSGGGGGGHRTVAGKGGAGSRDCAPVAVSGIAGQVWGSAAIDVLRGGAAGGQGAASVCAKSIPGAGGGAVQLSAFEMISIAAAGSVNVGGGGGAGGINCGGTDTGAGSGGGSGGALFLDAPSIERHGALGANGGGGGGGASSPGTTGSLGGDAIASLLPARGGAGGGAYGTAGGSGATGSADAADGVNDDCDGNGGGGGGGVGAIVIHAGMVAGGGVVSPLPLEVPFAR